MIDIANYRLASQQILNTRVTTAKEIVGWMGAMQAQDYAMVKWALGLRLPGSTDRSIEAALASGDILRTHALRPTWHLVSAGDIAWIVALTGPRIKAKMKSRDRDLDLSEAIIMKSNAVIEKALSDGGHLTRNAIIAELGNNAIPTNENRASNLLMHAELAGIACSGAPNGKHQTYALLENRVPKTEPLSREAALAKLAARYFDSHGPASLPDFTWWSGLAVSEAKQALEMVRAGFASETVGSQTFWFNHDPSGPENEAVHLLPAFDEFYIGYTDRSAVLAFENNKKAVSENGIFRPVIVFHGQIAGIWKRTVKKEKVLVELDFFKVPGAATLRQAEKAALDYGRFLEKEVELVYKS